ncbi:hypothetical protein Tco_0199614 [Tanacetum coccineum]
MMTKIYQAFKGQSSSAPSSSVTLTLALTNIPANVEGENATNTAIKKPPSHTEGETEHPKMAIPISSIQPTKVLPTQAQPITTITTHPESFQAAPRIDKGKGIATKSDEDPSKKLVPASTIVRPDPDEEVKVPGFICNWSLPEGVPFANNMVIEEPEYGIFFTDVFGDQAFKIWNDIHKVRVDLLYQTCVMASMVKTEENARFSLKLRKLIADHPDQEKLKSKKVKLEALGYQID